MEKTVIYIFRSGKTQSFVADWYGDIPLESALETTLLGKISTHNPNEIMGKTSMGDVVSCIFAQDGIIVGHININQL